MAKIKIEVCDICGNVHKNMRELSGGFVCEECYWLDTIDDLRNPVLKRVAKTYTRLKAFEKLGLDVVEIKNCLNSVEESLKEEDSPIETVRTQIVGNFEKVSELETTLIFANIGELINKMQQADVALRDENEKLKKQTERLEKDKAELSGQINQIEDIKGKEVELKKLILEAVRVIVNNDGKLKTICELLKGSVPLYDWIGFYHVNKQTKRHLNCEIFAGMPPVHKEIPFGTGVCGTVAESKVTRIVDNVSVIQNYLQCDPDTKSEIVVPILKNGELVGVLDIDSHALAAFTEEDKKFLENVGEIVSILF